jgi:hypothetical protein
MGKYYIAKRKPAFLTSLGRAAGKHEKGLIFRLSGHLAMILPDTPSMPPEPTTARFKRPARTAAYDPS